MHDTHDVRKSIELDKQEHDREMLIDEMERRIEALERRFNTAILLNDLKMTEAGDYD